MYTLVHCKHANTAFFVSLNFTFVSMYVCMCVLLPCLYSGMLIEKGLSVPVFAPNGQQFKGRANTRVYFAKNNPQETTGAGLSGSQSDRANRFHVAFLEKTKTTSQMSAFNQVGNAWDVCACMYVKGAVANQLICTHVSYFISTFLYVYPSWRRVYFLFVHRIPGADEQSGSRPQGGGNP